MIISAFDENKVFMDGQYKKVKQLISKEDLSLEEAVSKIYLSEASKQIGKGKAMKYYFDNVRLFINPHDIFQDLAITTNIFEDIRNKRHEQLNITPPEVNLIKDEGAFFSGADFGHTMPDWENLLKTGFVGMLDTAENYLKNPDISESQKEFYLSVKYAYEGIISYIKRLQEKASNILSPNTQFAAKNLKALSERKPETIAEAMQLYFIFYMAQHYTERENLRSLGALDVLLYPFYKHDIENKIYTEDEIREMLKYFLFKWNSMNILANIPFNLCTETNELTYLILEEYIKLNVPDPKIHIKCDKNTPDRVYELVMDSIRNGNNSFVFINSDVAKKALINVGIEESDAENYTLIGCYEPSASGKEIPCTLNSAINMPAAVEVVLNNGTKFNSDNIIGNHSIIPPVYETFDSFYSAVKQQLKDWSKLVLNDIRAIEKYYPQLNQSPFISSTYEDCMKNGVDAYSNGAKYNNSSVCIFGFATFVDELIAIKKAVFEDKIISLDDLRSILSNNWKNNEPLRKTLTDKYPKYGNNVPEADSLACDIQHFMADCINNQPNNRGGYFKMGMFSIDWIILYGKMLGASADGRYAGEPVSKNMSPSIGMDKKGITSVINSATALDYTLAANGSVLDLSIHPTVASGDDGISLMTTLLRIYFQKGGYATHINVVSPETLKKAQKEPQKYKNLQVRLCGWNVYFTDLDIEMQNNMIQSMEV